ncbi:hypothetical protein EYR40_005829 [Pleurotus pulmonarius]|nr:hypothetical protein EYR36_005780 [Pleurotus pulmonarius]KAF4602614.1 hypothetical protein EYR40_005829 [Pleurotus pulmonarius]
MHPAQSLTSAAVQENDVDRRVIASPAFGTLLSPGSTTANVLEVAGPALGDHSSMAEPWTLPTTMETPDGTSSLVFPLSSATPTTPAIVIHACELDNKTLHTFRQATTQRQHPWIHGIPTSNFPNRSQGIGGGRGMMYLAPPMETGIPQEEEDMALLRPPRPRARKQSLLGHPYPRSSSTSERGRNREEKDLRPRNLLLKSPCAPVTVTVQRCIEQEHNNFHGVGHNFADAESGSQTLYCRIKVASQAYAARVAEYISRGITSGRGRFGAGRTGAGLADMV